MREEKKRRIIPQKGMRLVYFVWVFLIVLGNGHASLLDKFEPLDGINIKEFSFYDKDSKKIEGSSLVGRPAVLHFWGTLCPPCLKEMPSLDTLMSDAGQFDIYIICVDKKNTSAIEGLYQKHGWKNLNIYKDMDLSSLRVFQNRGTPASYFVGADGRVLGRVYGEVEWQTPESKKFLQDFVLGKVPSTGESSNLLQKVADWFTRK